MSDFNIYSPGDMFDSRDVIERIEELDNIALQDMADEEYLEYNLLLEFQREASTLEDWDYGVTFIADTYFETYAQEFAEDIGAIDREASWPTYHIDWEAAAEDLQQDYTDFQMPTDGVTYWAR